MKQTFYMKSGGTMNLICTASEVCTTESVGELQGGGGLSPCNGNHHSLDTSHPRWKEYLEALATLDGVPAICKQHIEAHTK